MARARAIEEALAVVDNSFVFRVGLSAHLEGFAIHPVIRLNRVSWERLDRLNLTTKDRIHVTRSLADGVIEEIHRLTWKALSQPDPGQGLNALDAESRVIGRTSGSRLAYSAVLLSGEWFGTQFFDQVTSLAITPYEGRVGQGEIVIARPDHPNVEVVLRFLQPLNMDASRAIRKVLEMSDPDLSLLTDGKSIFGMGRVQASSTATLRFPTAG